MDLCAGQRAGKQGNFIAGFWSANYRGGASTKPCSDPAFLPPAVPVAATTATASETAAAGALRVLGLAASYLLLSGDSPKKPDQYVVRGGRATPQNLMDGSTSFPYKGKTMSGFSVSSAPGVSVQDLAAAGNYKNGEISYTTTGKLEKLGVPVTPTPTSNNALHATAGVNVPLDPAKAAAISAAFKRIPNPNRCR